MAKITYLFALQFAFLSGCGGQSHSKSPQEAPKPQPTKNPTSQPPQKPNGTNSGVDRIDDITYENQAIIREFKSSDNNIDRAALFLVRPSEGKLEILRVSAPNFLTQVKVGTLDSDKMNSFFKNSGNEMSDDKKRELLEAYKGSTFLYFEKYDGQLCNLNSYQILAKAKLFDKILNLSFTFQASPSLSDDCNIFSKTFLTSFLK